MLTEQTNGDGNDSLSGVISISSGLDLIEMKGTLILDGEEDDDTNNERSKLSLPESVLLPSEITFENKLQPASAAAPPTPAKVLPEEEENVHKHPRTCGIEHCIYKRSTLLILIAPLFFITSVMSWGYIKTHNELRHLRASTEKQQSLLPLTLLLLKERRVLKERVASLEHDLIEFKARANEGFFSDDTDIDDDSLLVFENCYFKAALTAGACYKDWQSWFNEYMFKEQSAETPTDEEENFAYQLFDSARDISWHSYSFVEEGFKNVSFDRVDLAAFLVSSVTSMYGVHQHYGDGSESLMNIAKSVVDEGSAFARLIEEHSSKTLSSAVDYSTTWLKGVLNVVSEEDIFAWN